MHDVTAPTLTMMISGRAVRDIRLLIGMQCDRAWTRQSRAVTANACTAKAFCGSFGCRQLLDKFHLKCIDFLEDDLSDTITQLNLQRSITMIEEQHLDLSTIV